MRFRSGWPVIPRLIVFSILLSLFDSFPQINGFNLQRVLAADAPVEWSQFGQGAGHTNFAPQTISGALRFIWDWNSADKKGKSQADHLHVPDLVQPITGGKRVYMVADNTVFALDEDKGTELWKRGDIGTLNATPVYLNEAVYVGSEDGKVYKIDARTGDVMQSADLGGAISTALTTTDKAIIASVSKGSLVAVDPETLATIWTYDAGGDLATMPAYSFKHQTVVVVGKDLYVHAVDANTGKQKWKVKPTVRDYSIISEESNYSAADSGWPVIAEQHGVVFIRYRLEWNSLWALDAFPDNNAAIRAALVSKPDQQALFALNIDDGTTAFVPAVGNGGPGDGGMLGMGPMPVVREVDGQEVAYMIWRNQQACGASHCDGREDATMGEMVLDSEMIASYKAGDMRFVQFDDIQTDEMLSLSMVGDVLFNGHWLVDAGRRISDRSDGLGATIKNPIKTTNGLYVIWRQCYCPAGSACNPLLYPGGQGTTTCHSNCRFNDMSRYCPEGLYSYGDQRSYPAGFYQYYNDIQHTTSYPFTIGSGNLIIVKAYDGGLMAFKSGARAESFEPMPVSNPLLAPEIFVPTIPKVVPADAMQAVGKVVEVCGTIHDVVDHLPKAIYMSFTKVHDGQLLVRVFSKDLSKFSYDLKTLSGKSICVTGLMRLYYPELNAPEIIVDRPTQIVVR